MKKNFKETIEQIKHLKCLVLTKRGSKYSPDSLIFNIQGTRISLIVTDRVYDFSMSWRVKSKNKNQYRRISFEEILDHSLLSNKAKEELVFNLDVFLSR